jgi:hypothetical protein
MQGKADLFRSRHCESSEAIHATQRINNLWIATASPDDGINQHFPKAKDEAPSHQEASSLNSFKGCRQR